MSALCFGLLLANKNSPKLHALPGALILLSLILLALFALLFCITVRIRRCLWKELGEQWRSCRVRCDRRLLFCAKFFCWPVLSNRLTTIGTKPGTVYTHWSCCRLCCCCCCCSFPTTLRQTLVLLCVLTHPLTAFGSAKTPAKKATATTTTTATDYPMQMCAEIG